MTRKEAKAQLASLHEQLATALAARPVNRPTADRIRHMILWARQELNSTARAT